MSHTGEPLKGADPHYWSSYQQFIDHFQYRGWAPVSRVFSRSASPWDGTLRHYTHACQGTTALFRTVLRSLNIPVALARHGTGHWMPHFVSIAKYLSHGDDPYASDFVTTIGDQLMDKRIPARELLIDETTWSDWFEGKGDENLSRRVTELTLKYLPGSLLDAFCVDGRLPVGNEDPNGLVWSRRLKHHEHLYSFDYLRDVFKLWEKMDAKLRNGFGNSCVLLKKILGSWAIK